MPLDAPVMTATFSANAIADMLARRASKEIQFLACAAG
jgi:hypothetical protein